MKVPAASHGCVLVVDDDPDILYTLRLFLELDGHRVLTASSVNEALVILDREPVDVVLTDLVLPGLSGLDLLTALRGARERTEVVILTGHADVGSATDALRNRAFDYLHKPVAGTVVRSTVRRALEAVAQREEAQRSERAAQDRLHQLTAAVEARTAELRQSESRYRTLIESLPVLIVELDAETTRSTYAGGALLARLEQRFAAGIPGRFAEIFVAEDRPAFLRYLAGADEAGAARFHVTGGPDEMVLKGANVRLDEEGRAACVLFDVTAEHRAEAAKAELERQLLDARARLEAKLLSALELESGSRPAGSVTSDPPRVTTEGGFGISAAMRRVEELATLAAEHTQPVLVLGETGTGKGLIARFVHERSRRAPYVALNCSSLRGELLDSELFGHVRGAFTSAVKDRRGLVEEANGGTLFLDEIGETNLDTQARLLKLLEERTFRRVGESRERTSDFRLICATNRDLQAEVAGGRFRRDLLYRINLFTIELPPLRERTGDVPWLVQKLLGSLGAEGVEVLPETLAALELHSFPGNVRELRNGLIRATLLARGRPLAPEHFPELRARSTEADVPPAVASPRREPRSEEQSAGSHVSEADERARIQALLDRFDGNRAKVARTLGMSRTTLYKKLHAFGLIEGEGDGDA